MIKYIIGVGSSGTHAANYISKAESKLRNHPKIIFLSAAKIIKGPVVDANYFEIFSNTCFALESHLGLDQLWLEVRQIEHELGRMRVFHNGPRTIDLDILWTSEGQRDTVFLNLPHPQLTSRDFALRPALEIKKNLNWP